MLAPPVLATPLRGEYVQADLPLLQIYRQIAFGNAVNAKMSAGAAQRSPTNPPIAQLLVRPVPGWRGHVRMVKLAKPIRTYDGKFSVAVSEPGTPGWTGIAAVSLRPTHINRIPTTTDW